MQRHAFCLSALFLAFILSISLPARAGEYDKGIVTFTFDDGYQNQFDNALPVLKKYHLPATFFVYTQALRKTETQTSDAMTWNEVIELVQSGFEVGSHTRSHPHLIHMSTPDVWTEMEEPALEIKTNTGVYPSSFASPYGQFDDRVLAFARKLYESHFGGWVGTEAYGDGLNPIPIANPYMISRLQVERKTTSAEVCAAVEQARKQKLWLVLVFHGVVSDISSGNPFDEYRISAATLDAIAHCVATRVGQQAISVENARDAFKSVR
jgi:peptidoglycan/xylan/chitin deacetylase (PgdA/CDA1 family)